MISAIVATDMNNAIGGNNKLLFHIKRDLEYFKAMTMDNVVIMGRKTWESLPKKPLPNRVNIVVTSNPNFYSGIYQDVVFVTMETLKETVLPAIKDRENVFIIGGGKVYKELLPYCEQVYLTKIDQMVLGADTYFPKLSEDEWVVDRRSGKLHEQGVNFEFLVYKRSSKFKPENKCECDGKCTVCKCQNTKNKTTKTEEENEPKILAPVKNLKQVYIINGVGGSGKDTFVQLMKEAAEEDPDVACEIGNYSSVDKVKRIAKIIGWDGSKTEENRAFLSNLKMLTTDYNDMSMNDVEKYVDIFMNGEEETSKIMFIHIREPEEIAKAVLRLSKYNPQTILVQRPNVEEITSNYSDNSVYEYEDYDFIVNNDATFKDLKDKAQVLLYFSLCSPHYHREEDYKFRKSLAQRLLFS